MHYEYWQQIIYLHFSYVNCMPKNEIEWVLIMWKLSSMYAQRFHKRDWLWFSRPLSCFIFIDVALLIVPLLLVRQLKKLLTVLCSWKLSLMEMTLFRLNFSSYWATSKHSSYTYDRWPHWCNRADLFSIPIYLEKFFHCDLNFIMKLGQKISGRIRNTENYLKEDRKSVV